MKWFIAYIENGQTKVVEFKSQSAMLRAAETIRLAGNTILCVWSEVIRGL